MKAECSVPTLGEIVSAWGRKCTWSHCHTLGQQTQVSDALALLKVLFGKPVKMFSCMSSSFAQQLCLDCICWTERWAQRLTTANVSHISEKGKRLEGRNNTRLRPFTHQSHFQCCTVLGSQMTTRGVVVNTNYLKVQEGRVKFPELFTALRNSCHLHLLWTWVPPLKNLAKVSG